MQPFVGLISDTHGLLRPEAISALQGAKLIIHAGDVGAPGILEQLAEIAPVHAVRGNVDGGELGRILPHDAVVSWQGFHLYVLHIFAELDLDPVAAGFDAVIYGHSHKPDIRREANVVYINPGSAGPRRFSLPITVARLTRCENDIHVEHVTLDINS